MGAAGGLAPRVREAMNIINIPLYVYTSLYIPAPSACGHVA